MRTSWAENPQTTERQRNAVAESNRRRWAARAAEKLAAPKPVVPESSLVSRAIAERSTGKPLVVETLEQRLARLLPGAVCFREGPDWVVCRLSALARHELARRPSEREAIDVAVSLWGGR